MQLFTKQNFLILLVPLSLHLPCIPHVQQKYSLMCNSMKNVEPLNWVVFAEQFTKLKFRQKTIFILLIFHISEKSSKWSADSFQEYYIPSAFSYDFQKPVITQSAARWTSVSSESENDKIINFDLYMVISEETLRML